MLLLLIWIYRSVIYSLLQCVYVWHYRWCLSVCQRLSVDTHRTHDTESATIARLNSAVRFGLTVGWIASVKNSHWLQCIVYTRILCIVIYGILCILHTDKSEYSLCVCVFCNHWPLRHFWCILYFVVVCCPFQSRDHTDNTGGDYSFGKFFSFLYSVTTFSFFFTDCLCALLLCRRLYLMNTTYLSLTIIEPVLKWLERCAKNKQKILRPSKKVSWTFAKIYLVIFSAFSR